MAIGNTVAVVGNITSDPEVLFSKSGLPITRFSVAQNVGEGENRRASYYDVTCFDSTAQNVAKLVKGDRVVVMGRLDFQEWVDQKTNNRRTKVAVVADTVGADMRWAEVAITKNVRDDAPVPEFVGDETF